MSALVATLLFLILLIDAALPSAGESGKADFFVSPKGRDSWSGRLDRPNGTKTDGPFATPERAVEAVREKLATATGKPILVQFRQGTYYLTKPLEFTPADSGSLGAPVVYASFPGEKAVLSGGTRLTGFRKVDGAWRVNLPMTMNGGWNFCQLWVNGQRRFRPRLPREGYYSIAEQLPPTEKSNGKGWDRFRYRQGDIDPSWHNLNDVEVLGFQIWTMARFRIGSIEPEQRIVNFTGRTLNLESYSALPAGNRYLVENVKEAFGKPGEWHLDKTDGTLSYTPLPGETLAKSEIVAPRIDSLLQIKGDPANHKWVESIQFKGLVFAHSNWNAGPEGYTFYQAESVLPGAILAEGARDCRFDGCDFEHTGTYGLEFANGCKRCVVDGCSITDVAAGGIKIGIGGITSDKEQLTEHNTVSNCVIAHGGRMHPAGIGVWIGESPYNTISHNEIADFYYTGISVGWTWGYGESQAHHNVLEYNHIHDIGQGVLSDMGGTYTLGICPGSVERYNVIHDVDAFTYGGWGIYFDEGTSGMLAENNVVYRTKAAGFHQHYGKENELRNNIFAFGREAQVMRTRVEDHLSFTFDHNIVYWTEGPLLGSNWSENNYKLDYNMYWNAAGKSFNFAGMTLDKWREKGQDTHSIIADPLFVNPDQGNFRLKPGSPASQIGFNDIDVSKVGPVTGPLAGTPPAKPRRVFPAPPPPAPPAPIVQNFEDLNVGDKMPGATTYEEDSTHVVRVTDETAAAGKHSLKFVDGPGQKYNYNPHVFFDPGFRTGTLQDTFALRVEKGAVMYHEWRDASNPYKVGPSIRIDSDGNLTAGGKLITRIPLGQWLHFKIVCALGKQAKGSYELTIQMPGRAAPITAKGLSCNPEFAELRWYGFTADGVEPSVFYLDDLELIPLSKK